MGSRDRDAKSLQDKLKVLFKKSGVAARGELPLTGELERELSSETPLPRRLRAVRDLADRVPHSRIQDGGVERVWRATRDLLESEASEARHATLALLGALCDACADRMPIMRTVLFRYLRETHAARDADDEAARLRLLRALTANGRNIACFEEHAGAFLAEWLPGAPAPLLADALQLLTNVVKYNASSLDEDVVHGIVEGACSVCAHRGGADAAVAAALALLEAVASYSLLPRPALRAFVATLARTVNLEQHVPSSWKLMRQVLGADIGYAALHELVQLLASDCAEAGLARGCVFYVSMALWGPRKVHALRVSYLAVLPALLQALSARAPVVTYEVLLGVQMLVARAHHELHEPAWDVLLDILRAVHEHDCEMRPRNEPIHSRLHDVLTAIEQLQQSGHFGGAAEALLELLDACGHERPEASALALITARADALAPSAGWVGEALALAERYVRGDSRLAVRLHALDRLLAFILRHRHLYGEELVERVGAPVAAACALDAEPALRAAAARALVEMARVCSADATADLVDLLEKILDRPFDMYVTDVPVPPDADVDDLRRAAKGLLELLHERLLRAPAAHAARAFQVLLNHLDQHYRRPALLLHHPDVRLRILDMIFGLRANRLNCVGFCYDAGGAPLQGAAALRVRPTCSPLLLAEARAAMPAGACVLPVGRAARLLVTALSCERDWAVLSVVLRALPALLQARAPAVGRRPQDVDLLASTLCAMVSDRSLSFPECLRSGAHKLTVSEFHSLALPPLAALAPYHAYLEPQTQQRIVRCLLKYGMVLRSPQPYINALTIFTLETRDTMVKMLPEVLLDLSKISDTKLIASPMLEFLSTLTRLPRVFASFVEDQYMSVFAILLPYTNPSRYNHYVVSLAHHVIAAWFLKCRLSYRRNFVRFIIHGLHNYIIMPFEEQLARGAFQPTANEDSSNRQRSSSLGSRAVSRAPLGGRGGAGPGGAGASAAFHVELTETCVDLLSRYAFTPCSVKPRRSDTAEFIFSGGQAMTWLVGHKLVTITTSGCQQNSLKQGPCERCAALCRQHAADGPASPLPASDDDPDAKRWRSLQHSRSTDTSCSSASELLPPTPAPSSAQASRQNSGEGARPSAAGGAGADPVGDALAHFSQRLERISRELDGEESRAASASALAPHLCPCWCAHWAEVHVRSPTGDVSWAMRMQNNMSFDYLLESPLQDVAALLATPSSASSGLGDSRPDVSCVGSEPRSRSGSASSHFRAADLHKSSSDSVVSEVPRGPAPAPAPAAPQAPPLPAASRASTQPINIPVGLPRQGSAPQDDDDDMLLVMPTEGKSRHLVRRSNSSPEMSSSWKVPERGADEPPAGAPAGPAAGPAAPVPRAPQLPDDVIVLPAEPCALAGSAAMSLHASKKAAKKSADMRVSCEAIPEEMCGTSPLQAHSQPQPQRPQPQQPAPAQLQDDLPPLARSKRSNTISVMSPTRRARVEPRRREPARAGPAGGGAGGGGSGGGGGVTPSFVFLQLYHNMSTYPTTPPVPGEAPGALDPLVERPLRVAGAQHERTIKNLDLVPPIETHKVGVLYVGPEQHDNEVLILRNEYGSVRYAEFLTQLGSLVSLDGGEEQPDLFLNLEKGGRDGRYTYVWSDDVMQLQFHVATAMPSLPTDPNCNEKRKYIGNDYVSIVYNDSGADFNIHTIKGQLNFCIVVVEPFEHGMNRVFVKTKDERIRTTFLAHQDTYVVSDTNVALLARQIALHCALASQISQSLTLGGAGGAYASNALERLRLIKRLRRRVETERLAAAARAPEPYNAPSDLHTRVAIDDFNDYT